MTKIKIVKIEVLKWKQEGKMNIREKCLLKTEQ